MLKDNGKFLKQVLVSCLVLAGLIAFIKEFYGAAALSVSPLSSSQPQVLTDSAEGNIVREVATIGAKQKLNVIQRDDFVVSVPVLMYHYVRDSALPSEDLSYYLSVKLKALDEQFSYLRQNGYQTLSLNDLYESLSNRTPLPPRSVVITFDDGFRDFYYNAFPIIKKHNIRVVSFYVVNYTSYPNYMNWEMLREIHNSGLVDIESHTLSHLPLTSLEPEQLRAEIFESKRILEEGLGKKVNYFAYPYGIYNEEIVNLVVQAGYRLAFSTRPGAELRSSEQLILKRVTVSGFDSLDTFKAKLSP